MSVPYQTLFVTGGAGYIGSHFLEHWMRSNLQEPDAYRIVILDDLSGGHLQILSILEQEFRAHYETLPILERVDLCDLSRVRSLFKTYRPSAVVHFAGKISVAESVQRPDFYYQNNVEGSENLLLAMQEYGCRSLVFSSTAAVYGNPATDSPLTEEDAVEPVNPYGDSKLRVEHAIRDAHREWGLNAILFRYFNACGAALSGKIGEWHEPETHLIPLILESVLRPAAELNVYGTDYPTRDGSCVRDYIHVTDLAQAHVLGLERLLQGTSEGVEVFNLGTEKGTTVLEVIQAVQKVTGKKVRIKISARRPGDASTLVASAKKAMNHLRWVPQHSDIETILRSAYGWQKNLAEMKRQD